MYKYLLSLMIILIAVGPMACDQDNGYDGFNGLQGTNANDFSFVLLDSSGNPLNGVFWAVTGTGFTAFGTSTGGSSLLSLVDANGDSCANPDDNTPQTFNETADQDGCTGDDGSININCTHNGTMTLYVDDGSGQTDNTPIICPVANGSGGTDDGTEITFDEVGGSEVDGFTVLYEAGTSDGNLGGRAGADAMCESAKPAFLSQDSVRAFLSAQDPKAHGPTDDILSMPGNFGVPTDIAIVSLDATQISSDWAGLFDSSIDATLETAGVTSTNWWGGTKSSGFLTRNCQGFSTNSSKDDSAFGAADRTDGGWLHSTNQNCSDTSLAVLCVAFDSVAD